ncbi:c-type cytochrome [Runella zeae]|uniref:c-type cytochrome n=1 Tax=Runella zeae TaxID=94255 RepID=UPI0023558FD1|nr:cytochrome c [Runella zeae]
MPSLMGILLKSLLVFPLVLGLLFSKQSYTPKQSSHFSPADTSQVASSFGFGRLATQTEIDRIDIDVRPDGKGLPQGKGVAAQGKLIFATKCAACHGTGGIGGPNGSLVHSQVDPTKKRAEKTIGNYWPYATTVFDYIRRAMPFNAPGSLTNEEVYHLTAYLLSANQIIDSSFVVTPTTLPTVKMPAQPLFIPDDRKGGPVIK